jgi:molybdopterin converting factor small subunit
MKIRVRLFAFMAQAVGMREVELDLSAGATIHDVERTLKIQMPQLPWPGNVMWAINQEYIAGAARREEGQTAENPGLKEGDEVAIIPPVSGG